MNHSDDLVCKLSSVGYVIKILAPVVNLEPILAVMLWEFSTDTDDVFQNKKSIICVMFQLDFHNIADPFKRKKIFLVYLQSISFKLSIFV